MFALAFPPLNPVMLSIGPITIHWYAMAYVAGFVLGIWLCKRLALLSTHGDGPKPMDYDEFLTWAVIGTLLGGRLGYVLFYQFDMYLAEPIEALKIWHGGMSFHGGMLGVILSAYLFTRRRKISFFRFTDLLACVTPIGLGLGRITNFVNGELYGRATDVPWAVVFPKGGDVPRHPSQLYEAALEGVVLFIIMMIAVRVPFLRNRAGVLSGLFLSTYALFRFIAEFFREPDPQLGFLFAGATMGQLLCIPMFLFGEYLVARGFLKKESA